MSEEISSPIGPTIFIGILSYMTASFFTSIFDMAMTTILECFVIDEEVEGNFADEDLKIFLSSYSKIEMDDNNDESKRNNSDINNENTDIERGAGLGASSNDEETKEENM